GLTWTNTTTGIRNVTASSTFTDLVMDPNNSSHLYCAIGEPFGAAENGVYVTTDAGGTWNAAGNFPLGTANGDIRLAISKSNPQVLYAPVANPNTDNLLRILKTTDGGTTWNNTTVTPSDYMGGQGSYDSVVIVDPGNENTVYVGGATSGNVDANGNFVNGFLVSTDGGGTWTDITVGTAGGNGPPLDHHPAVFDPHGKLLDGNDGGVWRLDSAAAGSVRWTDLNGNLATLQFIGLALHPTDPNIAYGGTQDNGTEKFIGALPWTLARFGDSGFVRVDPVTP